MQHPGDELLEYGSILVNTENPKEIGDILSRADNSTESGAPDLRIVADAPNGAEQWFERKLGARRPLYRHFYYAVPIGNSANAADDISEDQPLRFIAPSEYRKGTVVASCGQAIGRKPMEALTQGRAA